MLCRIVVSIVAAAAFLFALHGLGNESDRLAASRAELNLLRKGASDFDLAEVKQVLSQYRLDCRNEFRRAATAFSSADLAASTAAESTLTGLRHVEENIRAQLRCSPSDGNAWLLLAVISHQAGNAEPEVPYVRLSQSNSPREGWIVERRIDFICSTAKSSFDRLAEVLQRDFEVLLSDRLFEKVVDHYAKCREQIGGVLEAALARVGSGIRDDFVRAMALRVARTVR